MALSPKLFIHEFVTGGGWSQGELPEGLADEALAMLWALLVDFNKWGQVRTSILLDARFENQIPGLDRKTLPADEVILVEPQQHASIFADMVKRSDAVLVLAPETGGNLARLTKIVEDSGVLLLGSSSVAVLAAGDKVECFQRFQKASLPTPPVQVIDFDSAIRRAGEFHYPAIIKPQDGVGCEGVCLVNQPSEMAEALKLARKATHHDKILVQPYIKGVNASVSLLVAQDRAVPLSLNGQDIEPGRPFTYCGGIVPLAAPAAARAFEVACEAVRQVPGLQGYVGIDLVLAQDEAWLIEINPRLTTSYVGLRQVLSVNLARAIWDACRFGILPEQISITGKAVFVKRDPGSWKIE
ncbi:MAG TPA: ATP-grasp domain-containing protein [Anaerolineaceae bacterium]|nr:ATP-grasp domain-containing protein [Anaerolineaceae bacterium]